MPEQNGKCTCKKAGQKKMLPPRNYNTEIEEILCWGLGNVKEVQWRSYQDFPSSWEM